MSKLIAVEGCTLTIDTGTGTAAISTAPSTVLKAQGKKVYAGDLTVNVTNGVSGSCGTSTPATGTGTISPGSTKVKTGGNFVVLEDDESGTITMNGQEPASPSGTQACSYTLKVKISAAGQIKAKAE